MSYTNVFGGTTIYPSDVSYLALSLSADNPLEWPLESSGTEDPAARIIDVTPTASGFSVIMPDATLTGAGQTILFNNLSGSYSFYVKDFAGNTLATVAHGEQWQLYLAVTTTPAGTWRVFRYGASTATVQPSALAGFGLTVTGATLSQALPVTTFSTTGLTLASSNRAGTFVWNGSGAGTLNLLAAASAGNNFFVLVRNAGGGDLTIDPAGTEVIDGGATLTLHPGDSCTVITDGVKWYTIGLGQQAVFAFDYTSINVTGGNYTLSGSELNRISYKFVGTLTSDVYIIIPATVQQYWITNATTGSFNFYVKIAGGVPTQVQQGAKGIYYCDGTNVILASDPTSLSTPITVAQGGTGATTASGARLNLGITTFADAIVTATSGATVRTTIGAAASGANGDITSLSGLTTALSVAQGGTGATTATDALTSLGAYPASNPSGFTSNTGTVTSVSGAGSVNGITLTGTVTASGSLTLGGTLSGVSLATQVTDTLPVANGGTGATTAAAALTSLGAYPASNPSGYTTNVGTVTSVGGTGTVNGLTLTGTVTGSGNLTLGGTLSGVSLTTQVTGTLPVANGGTGATTAAAARASLGSTTLGDNLFTIANPSAVTFPRFNADNTVSALDAASFRAAIGAGSGGGSVTSVAMSVPAFLSVSGSPITTSGTLAVTLSGAALPVANGGTGATTAAAALTSLGAYPSSNPSGYTSNTGTVTSVSGTGSANGLTLTGTVTGSGSLTLGGSVTSVASGATIDGVVIGYRNIPRSTTSGTATTGDVGKVIAVAAGITIPNATFSAGDAVSIYNDSASAVTITQGTSLTLRQAGTTNTGNRTLAARGVATIWFNSSSEAIISGAGVS
jgi:hypothetical protein